MKRIILAVTVIGLLAQLGLLNAASLHHNHVNRTMKLNDVIEMDCGGSLTATSTSPNTLTTKPIQIENLTLLNETLNGFDIFIFKKDNVLINLFRVKLRIKLTNLTDQGVYECGFYRFDKYGSLNYVAQKSWLIKITNEDHSAHRLLSKHYMSDLMDVNYKKINFNFITRNPVRITFLGVLMIAGLFCVFLFLTKETRSDSMKLDCVNMSTQCRDEEDFKYKGSTIHI